MGFSKKQHLQQNIDALRIAFKLEKEKRQATVGERLLMMQYSGFGGLKFVLNPIANEIDINNWRKTEHDLFPITQELHQLLKENSEDEKQYRRYVDSMKSSVLTAFYTPPQVIDAISATLRESGLNIDKFLEPSAGIGSFIQSFSENQKASVTAYEKDLLTGKILKQLYPESTIRISGFEEISEKEQNSFDVIASNIPFGDTSVFDLSYSRSKDSAKVQASRSIHNYFFLKGADMLREGGLLAYITSQGILNSPKNEPIRRALMQGNNLVSVVRLPNNLFTEYAGTEVGSDLIILQKNTAKQNLTEAEELFCRSSQTKYNTPGNALFQDSTRIVHTDRKLDTDPYGQPALIYTHKGGVEGISKDLKQMLSEDFGRHLNLNLYKGERNDEPLIQIPIEPTVTPPVIEPVTIQPEIQSLSVSIINRESPQELKQLSIFDLFENVDEPVMVAAPPKKTTQVKRQSTNKRRGAIGRQPDLFSSVMREPYTPPVTNRATNGNTSTNGKKQEAIGDLFSQINGNGQADKPAVPNTIPEPAPYSGELQSYHRNDCLVVDNGWVGHLQDVDTSDGTAVFHPLQLPTLQKARAEAYIAVRDVYQDLYNISIAYFQIFVYNQQLELLKYNKETYEKQIEIYRLQVSKGITLQKDLDKVNVDYNNTISQIRVAQSNLKLAENELKYEMGYPINDLLTVNPSTELGTTLLNEDSTSTFSPASRIDYKLSELNIKTLEIEQARIKAEGLPKLSAYFRYGAVGFGDKLSAAYDELLPYSAVGLKLSIPILDFYKRNAQYKQAKINRINAEESLKLAEGKYKVEYENAYTKLSQAQTNVENDKRNVELAESVLKVTDLQFQKGTTNLTDWLNTQNSLKEAQNSYLNSLYSYYQARIDLEKAAGSLKTFYNSL